MIVSVSAVVLLGLLIWFLLRIRYFRWAEVLICSTFGFLLAETGAGPVVRSGSPGRPRRAPQPTELMGGVAQMISMKNGSRRGAKSPNPTPSGTHSIRYVSSERSSLTLSTRIDRANRRAAPGAT